MAENLTVKITAQDGASQTFKAISSASTTMGDAIERAGADGAKGLDQLGKSAKTNATSMEKMKSEATAIGAVMGALGSGAILAGQAFKEQERQIDGIRRVYGDAGNDILAMAERMQDLTRYSNDAARESSLLAGSLVSNYDLSAQQVEVLVQRSADLAQIYGFTLPDAVQRTSSALRGEGESAERLGLNMSDAAIAARALDAGITNWNVPGALSEAEKAAFRFQVFMEDTESTVGAAGEAANSAGGNFRQFANQMQDAGQSVGGFLGPVGQVAAEFAPIAIALPVISAGAGRMATALKGSSIAMGALGVATNPVVLGLAALGIAGLYAWNVFNEGQEASQSLEDALLSLGDVAQSLRLGHRDEQAGFIDEFRQDIVETGVAAEDFAQSVRIFDAAQAEATRTGTEMHTVLLKMQSGFRLTSEEQIKFAAAQEEIGAMFANSQINATELNRSLDHQRMLLDTGAITYEQYAENIAWFTENQDKFRVAQDASTDSAAAAEQALLQEAAAADELAASMQEVLDRLLAVSGVDDPLSQLNLSDASTYASYFADRLVDAGTALETVFRVVVGNTDAFASQTQAVADWADELIGAKGTYAEIDDLLASGLITQQQYNDAQQAQIGIAESNASAQMSVLAIQASQAPLIAEHTAALANELDLIRQMPADVQLVALGWMDATTAGRAMEFQSLAVSVANGELGASGSAAFTAMITGAANADPVLKALLIDLGLISEEDGKMTVSLDGAEGVISDLDRVNQTIGDLIDILDNGELDGSYLVTVAAEDNATPVIQEVSSTLEKLLALGDGGGSIKLQIETATGGAIDYPDVQTGSGDGTGGPKPRNRGAASIPESVTTSVNIEDNASPTLDALIESMRWYDGQESTASLSADDLATRVIDAASTAMDIINGKQSYMQIGAIDSASRVIISASALLNAKHGNTATLSVLGNNADAVGKISRASGALAAVNGNSAMMRVLGNNADALNKVSQIRNLNGVLLSTAYHKIQTLHEDIFRTVKQSVNRRHGGIIPDLDHFASGGMVPFWAGENGPEVAHFAGGGTALIPSEGVYAAPPGTYISPSNAYNTSYGGATVTINVNGPVFGIDDLSEKILREIGPAIQVAMRQHERGQGVI